MRIESIETYFFEYPLKKGFYPAWIPGHEQTANRCVLLKLISDEGIEGIGAGSVFSEDQARLVRMIVEDTIGMFLIGADPADIEAKMEAALAKRAATQPVEDRSCGSTFRNPAGFSSTGRDDDVHDLKAWKLIEDAGMKGATLGGAQMSTKHANFLINKGGASATELEELGERVRKRVLENSGITLEWEIMRVGETLDKETPDA